MKEPAVIAWAMLLLCENAHSFLPLVTTSVKGRTALFRLHSIQVCDGVFSTENCNELHFLAQEHAVRSKDGSSVFFRDAQQQSQHLTPIEQALNSFLNAVDDPHDVVEYWQRDNFLHIDAHADVDEQELEQDGRVRCPEFGHVLYLIVDPSIRGPTCVFPTKKGGWSASKDPTTPIVTVPAVQGRVLRFPGSCMHAVPKPANRFLLSDEEERVLREQDEEDIWSEDDDDDVERSVILFNTWSREGPKGVTEDYSEPFVPDGIMLDNSDDMFKAPTREQRSADWEEDYGPCCQNLWCRPKTEWTSVKVAEKSEGPKPEVSVKIPLMGWKVRRIHPKKKVYLSGGSSLRSGLESAGQPMKFHLVQREE